MKGIIGKKMGMTSLFREDGTNVPCTVIEVEPNIITQIKTKDEDGYRAVQVATIEKKEKSTTQGMLGHFEKAGTTPKQVVREFRRFDFDANVGDEVTVEIFEEGEMVNLVGTSKGKGFQGVVKRHGFSGVGGRTHGQHNRERAPGAIGQSSDPSRVYKGMRMGGQTGNQRVKMKNLRVEKILPEKNVIFIKGAVPGHKGSIIIIEK